MSACSQDLGVVCANEKSPLNADLCLKRDIMIWGHLVKMVLKLRQSTFACIQNALRTLR